MSFTSRQIVKGLVKQLMIELLVAQIEGLKYLGESTVVWKANVSSQGGFVSAWW